MKEVTLKEFASKGGQTFWAGKSKEERSQIWKERAKVRFRNQKLRRKKLGIKSI